MALDIKLKKKAGDFDLDIEFHTKARRIGILGSSGCGKSMTLKAITGIVRPDAGYVKVDGRCLFDSASKTDIKIQKRRVGYLFQNYALFPTMTVAQNIAIGMKVKGQERDQKVREYIEKYALENLEKRRPHELSGGQQQRVALARIMASEPDLLLLDEPFSALDGHLKEQLMEEMISDLEDFKGDIILVSHSREEIYEFCQEVIVIHEGRVIGFGETKEVFKNPGNVECAALTGCKNIIPAEKRGEKTIYVPEWGIDVKTEQWVPDEIQAIGIRAHYIRVHQEKPLNMENTISARIDRISELPFEWYCFFVSEQGGRIWWKIAKSEIQVGEETFSLKKGETYYLTFPPHSLILLKGSDPTVPC